MLTVGWLIIAIVLAIADMLLGTIYFLIIALASCVLLLQPCSALISPGSLPPLQFSELSAAFYSLYVNPNKPNRLKVQPSCKA